jgi:predicted transcriptional regulator
MSEDFKTLAAQVVASYVSNNTVGASELPGLIAATHAALAGAFAPQPAADAPETVTKATRSQIAKSVTPDALICLACGASFKSMKRHLAANHGQTPGEYRMAYGLPSDYPMVAPAYSEQRSAYAKSIGLGKGVVRGRPAAPPAIVQAALKAPTKAKAAPKAKTPATAADKPPVKPAKASRPAGAIDPASDQFE